MSTNGHILVVDDISDSLNYIVKLLKAEGYIIFPANYCAICLRFGT